LVQRGHEVELFATGDSLTSATLRSLYRTAQWPPTMLDDLNHVSWAMQQIAQRGSLHPHHRNTRQLLLSEENLPALERMIALARSEHGQASDFLVGLQLTHSGRWSYPTPLVMFHDPALRNNGRIITDDELDRLQDRYVQATLRARDIGVDFIDIKQCHRYLLSEMLAARTRPGGHTRRSSAAQPASAHCARAGWPGSEACTGTDGGSRHRTGGAADRELGPPC